MAILSFEPIAMTFVTIYKSCVKEAERISGAIEISEARINKRNIDERSY